MGRVAKRRNHAGHITIEHGGAVVRQYAGIAVLDCQDCGFIHQSPLPSAETVAARYQKDFYAVDKPDYLKKEYVDSDWLFLWHNIELDAIAESIAAPARWKKRLLDVGCGFGTFMQNAEERGWATVGIEPSEQANAVLERAKLSCVYGAVEDTEMEPLGEFAAIRAAWVFEHLADPSAVLEKLKCALMPGGVLEIIVPNDFTDIQFAAEKEVGVEGYWLHPTHINYWNARSLTRFLESAGMRAVRVFATFPMELFLFGGNDYVNDPATGASAHQQRKTIELGFAQTEQGRAVLLSLAGAWAEAGFGRDIIVFARNDE